MVKKRRQDFLIVVRALPWVLLVLFFGFMGPPTYDVLGIDRQWHTSLTALLIAGIGIAWRISWRPVGSEAEWIRFVPWLYGLLATVMLIGEAPALLDLSDKWRLPLHAATTALILVTCGWFFAIAARHRRRK